MPDFLDKLANQSATNVQVQDQRERANQQPAITDAKDTGVAAQATADAALLQPPLGTVMGWAAWGDPPGGNWLVCDGRLLNQADYADLYAVLGSAWNTGGEGAGQFRIPDTQSRVIVGAGQASGLSYRALASKFGAETHTLTLAQVASHHHGDGTTSESTHEHVLWAHSNDANDSSSQGWPAGGHESLRTSDRSRQSQLSSSAVSSNVHDHGIAYDGNDQAHNNVQPSIALSQIIRVR